MVPVGQQLHAAVCSAALVPTCAMLPPVLTDTDCKAQKRYITGTRLSSKGRVKQRPHVSDQGGEDYPWLGFVEGGLFGGPPGGGWGAGGGGGGGGQGGLPGDSDSDRFRFQGPSPWSVGAWHAVCLASLANTAVFAAERFRQDCCC